MQIINKKLYKGGRYMKRNEKKKLIKKAHKLLDKIELHFNFIFENY